EVQLDAALSTSGDMSLDMPELTQPGDGGAERYVDHPVSKRLALLQWWRVELQVTLPAGGGAGTASLSINGAPALTTPINVLVKDAVPEIILGMTYVGTPSESWSLRYDNGTFDAK